jgi:hypothetical protein
MILKNHPHTCPSTGLPEKTPWCQEKVLILTACFAKQVRCPSFSIGSDASYDFGTVYSLQTILYLLEKVVQADLLIAN